MMNGYQLMKEFYLLNEEIMELSDKLQCTSLVNERERVSREVDHKLTRQLEIKHMLERIKWIV